MIYAFGCFDRDTDEVYNRILRLNLETRQSIIADS